MIKLINSRRAKDSPSNKEINFNPENLGKAATAMGSP
jgi:hypothetical protein